jgi:hypothetical protein
VPERAIARKPSSLQCVQADFHAAFARFIAKRHAFLVGEADRVAGDIAEFRQLPSCVERTEHFVQVGLAAIQVIRREYMERQVGRHDIDGVLQPGSQPEEAHLGLNIEPITRLGFDRGRAMEQHRVQVGHRL